MDLRNYLDISKNNVDMYFQQVREIKPNEITAKASVNVGILKEVGAKETSPESEHQRLETILTYLNTHRSIGTIAQPKGIFRGENLRAFQAP